MTSGMLQQRSSLVVRSFSHKTQLFLHVSGSVADSPEIPGSTSNVPTSTRSSQSTFTPEAVSSSLSSSPPSSSKSGAISGGIVGGIVGAALIAGVVAWLTFRRRRACSALSAIVIDDRLDMRQEAVLYPIVAEVPRLYVREFFSLSADHMWSYRRIVHKWLTTLPRTP